MGPSAPLRWRRLRREAFENSGFPIPPRHRRHGPYSLSYRRCWSGDTARRPSRLCERTTEAVGKNQRVLHRSHGPVVCPTGRLPIGGLGTTGGGICGESLSRGMRWAVFSGWSDGGWPGPVGLPTGATSWQRSRGLFQARSGYTPDVRLAPLCGISSPRRAIKKGGHRPTDSEPTHRGDAPITLHQRRPSL